MSHDIEIAGEEIGMELEPVAPAPVTLFRSDDPNEVVARATDTANVLANVVRQKKLTTRIGSSDHVRVEGWTLLGTMLGVFPVCVWTRKLANPEGWEARVEARTLAGLVVGAAEAQCTRDEGQWSFEPKGRDGRKQPPRDDYALRSMAQTRATSKALRQPLGFVMTLAGFSPTPAEEMPSSSGPEPQAARATPVAPVSTPAPQGEAPSGPVISGPQHRRLMAIASGHKVPHEDVKKLAAEIAGVDSTTLIPRAKYEAVVTAVEEWSLPF